MRYIRISIEAQSQLSVPPAPEVICITALRLSSSALSMLWNSRSSTVFRTSSYAESTSSGLSSPAFINSNRTLKSSRAILQSSNLITQDFKDLICFITFSAFLESFQNSGSWVCFSSSMTFNLFESICR